MTPSSTQKWLDSGRNDDKGTSVLLLWTKRIYDPNYKVTLADQDFDELLNAAMRESKIAAKTLSVAPTTKSLPRQFRALYSPNRWGRWIWRDGGTLQQRSSPPGDGPIIEDKALHQLFSFFGDCEVLHELLARK